MRDAYPYFRVSHSTCAVKRSLCPFRLLTKLFGFSPAASDGRDDGAIRATESDRIDIGPISVCIITGNAMRTTRNIL